jgi:murein DD-endopeptidase MepM/ murein hydrolase activator NlpD
VTLRTVRLAPLALLVCLSLTFVPPVQAQTPQCGYVESIRYPIDTDTFQLVQDYGAPSGRHQGRYHTGEDWYGGRGTSYGQPVHAIAAGRVTFSSPNGWGRDGGVVIIEHTFPDGTTAYSQYGHMTETDRIIFPFVYTCVREGDIIGAVGDARPAPHLHFEMRVNNPDIPGPGYTWTDPALGGWRDPGKLVRNWGTWLSRAASWHADLIDEAGPLTTPVMLEDLSLIYLDTGRVARLSPDGRVLWRVNLNQPAAGLLPAADGGALIYADGRAQIVLRDGTLGETWQVGAALDPAAVSGGPLRAGDQVLFHTPDNAVIAFDAAGRSILWRLEGIPQPVRWHVTGPLLGVITGDNRLLTIALGSAEPAVIDEARLREPGALASAANGDLLAYLHGGLWRVDGVGTWSLEVVDAPPGGRSAALTTAPDGSLYLFDGETIAAYDAALMPRWQADLPAVRGEAALTLYGDHLLLASSDGLIAALDTSNGAVCQQTRIFGEHRARLWRDFGADGIVRIAAADQVLGLDWRAFLGACVS